MSESSKNTAKDKRQIFVFIHRLTKPAKLKEEAVDFFVEKFENDAIRTINEESGFLCSLHLVRHKTEETGDVTNAISLCLLDPAKKNPPFIDVFFINAKQEKQLRQVLAFPHKVFEKVESDVLILDGEYSDLEIESNIKTWEKSLKQTTN